MTEGLLKKRIIFYIVICRLIILLAVPLLAGFGGFTSDERYDLTGLLLPVSCLYFTLCIKFVARNRYLLKGKTVNKTYFMMGYPLLGILYTLELAFLLSKAFFNLFSSNELYWLILLTECVLGAYAGFYLSGLYTENQYQNDDEP